jgi:5-methyltetrahydrofolate--homocysteine methyltransferase
LTRVKVQTLTQKALGLAEKCRQKPLVVDWKTRSVQPVKPSFLGRRQYNNVPLEELLPYIDWNPFFAVWQLRGKY